MNTAHWHLLLNHVPVLGLWFALALLAAAAILRNRQMIQVSWLALAVLALLAIPVYLTGEPSEDIVEGLPSISKPAIEEHEESAKISLIGIEVLGALALLSLVITRRREDLVRPLTYTTLAAALICAGLMSYTANLGGQIHHPEIRGDALSGGMGGDSGAPHEESGESHERDER